MSSTDNHEGDYPQPIKGESYQHFQARVNEREKRKEEHALLVKSGMFWEFYPELTGDWEQDKNHFKKQSMAADTLKDSYSIQLDLSNMSKTIIPDPIKPNYYRRTIKGVEIDVIDIIKAWGLGFLLGNTLKYILRAGQKEGNSKEQDLRKGIENINREIGDGGVK